MYLNDFYCCTLIVFQCFVLFVFIVFFFLLYRVFVSTFLDAPIHVPLCLFCSALCNVSAIRIFPLLCRLVNFFLFFYLLFYFCLSPQCILPLYFSFSLHTFCPFLLLSLVFDLYISSTSVTFCCCFLFSRLCQCIIV